MQFIRSFVRGATALAFLAVASFGIASASTITVNKTFSPTTVNLGAASTVTVTLENNSTASTATVTNFADDIATMSGYATLNTGYTPTTTCVGGNPSISGTSIVMTAGTIPKGTTSVPGSCTITFQVYGAIVGNGFNTISAANVSTSLGSPSADVTQTLTINSVNVTITNGPARTGLTGLANSVTPTITINNPAATVPLTNVAFSVETNGANLPYTINNISNSCGATTATTFPLVVNSSSVQTFHFTGGTIPAAGTCVVTFDVSEGSVGTVNMTLPATTVTDAQNVSNTSAGSTQARFVAGPTVTKSFNPTTLVPGSNATLTIRVQNTLSTTELTNAAITDNFPISQMTLVSTPSSSGCNSSSTPTFGGVGTSTLTMSGASIAAGATCTITATINIAAGASNGSITNSIPAGNFTSTQTSTSSGTANGSGTVSSTGTVSTAKSFSTGSAAANTPVLVTLKFVANGTGVTFTGGTFTDALPQSPEAMQVYNDGGAHAPSVSGCGSATAGNITATNGATSVSGSGLAIPTANGTCTVTFYVVFPNPTQNTTGTKDTNSLVGTNVSFTSSATSGTVHASNTSSASLTELPSLTLTNYVTSEKNLVNQPTTVQAAISDPGGASDSNVTVVLKTTTGKVSIVPNSLSFGAGCPAGTPSYALESVTITFASISASCTMTYQVVDEGGATGTFVPGNPTYAGTLTGGVPVTFTAQNNVTFSQTSIVVTKSFTPNQIQAGANSTADISLNVNPVTGFPVTLASGVSFSDSLPANVTFSASPNVQFGSGCNADGSNAQSYSIAGTTITFSGLAFENNGSPVPCVVSFSVTSSVVGAPLNVIPVGAVTSTSGATNSAKAQASLTVASGVGIAKSFQNASMAIGATNEMRLLFTNSASTTPLSGGTATDAMPSSLQLQSTTPGPTQPGDPAACTATIAGTVGSSNVSITGLALPALVGSTPGQCVLYVPVTSSASAAPGLVTNTIPVGALSIGGFANQNPASGSVTLTAPPAPTISKSFSPIAIAPGGNSTLTITIANTASGAAALDGMSLTDALPSGVTIATTPAATTTCGAGTVNAVAGGTSVALASGSVAAGASCTIAVSVTSVTAGSYVNTIPASSLTTTQGATNAAPASATLSVAPPVTVTKSFSPSTIASGGTSTLTISIANTAAGAIALGGLGLADSLPAGVTVASTPAASTTCTGGSLVATSGATNVALAGASLASGASCSITVNVTSSTPGTQTNTIPANAVSTTQGVTNAAPATATLTVAPPVTIAKAFAPSSITAGGTSTLTVTLANTASGAIPLSGMALTDTLPSGVTVASTPGAATTCGGTASATAGGSTLALAGGSLGAGATCTMSVTVTATVPNLYTNTIPVDALATTQGISNAAPASANLTVTSAPPVVVTKSFSPATIPVGGTSTLTIGIANSAVGAVALTSVALTDALPAGVTIASTPAASTTCPSGSLSAIAGGTSVALSGASLAANASCTITVNVTSASAGSYTNTIPANAVTSTQGGTNTAPATATLTVAPPVTITKAFAPSSITAGGTSTLTVTLANTASGAAALTGVTLTDTLPSGVTVASTPGAATTCGGTASATAGGSTLALTGGSLGAGATCTMSVTVTASVPNAYTNTIPANALGTTQGITNAAPASANLTVSTAPPVVVTKSFSPATIPVGGTSTLTIDVANTSAGAVALTSVAITDALPAGVTIASTPAASTTCPSGSLSAIAGGTSVALSGASLAANASCTIVVNVTSASAGSYTNTIPANAVTSTQGGTNTAPATATLTVAPPVTITKAFAPSSITAGGTSTLTVTLANTASGAAALTGVTLTDTLPSGVTVASTPGAATTCGGTASATAGGSTLVLTGGSLGAGATCTMSVTVTATVPNTYTNTIPANALGTTQGITNAAPASANLTITSAPPVVLTKSFSPATISPAGISTLTIGIANTAAGAVALTNLALTDALPSGVTIAATPSATTSCGGTVTAAAAGASVNLSGAALAANATCTISVHVTASTPGSYLNTIPAGTITTLQGATNAAPASATLTVVNAPPVTLTKSFAPATIAPGATSVLTIAIANTASGAVALSSVGVTDTLPAGVTVAATPNSATTCGGAVSANAGATSISLSGGSLAAGATCTIAVTVTGSTPGSYVNTIPAGGVSSAQGATNTAPASATLIIGAPSLKVSKTSSAAGAPVAPGQTIGYTIAITNTGSLAETNATITDTMTNATLVPGSVRVNGAAASDAVISAHAPFGSIAPGATTTITYSATVNTAASLGVAVTNSATAGGDQGCSGSSCTAASASDTIAAPSLTVHKLLDGGLRETVVPGQRVVYTMTVTNTGAVPALGAVVTDNVPAGITPIAGTVELGGAIDASATVQGQVVTVPLSTIPPSGTVTVSFAGTVNGSATGAIVNVVGVSARGLAERIQSNSVVANEVSAAIAVVKTASATVVSSGDRVNYAIVMTPPAGVAFGVTTVVDTLPDYEVYAPGTARVNGTSQEPIVRGHVLTWTLPALAARATITYAVAIAPGAPAEDQLTNVVNVSAQAPGGGHPGAGSASASVRVEGAAFGNCYPITGRVYEDFNGTGRFDDPDVGVGGVTIYLDDGESVVTDHDGRYDFPCVRPGMHALRLDQSTLPPGVTLFDDGNQIDSEKSRRRLVHRTYDLTILEDVNFAVKPPKKP